MIVSRNGLESVILTFKDDGRSSCGRYYIRTSWSERDTEDHHKAFYRPDAESIEELTDWTWVWDTCVDACNTHANLNNESAEGAGVSK